MEETRTVPEAEAPAVPAAPAPYAPGTGSTPLGMDRTAFDRMGYRERLALKRDDPETYRTLKNS